MRQERGEEEMRERNNIITERYENDHDGAVLVAKEDEPVRNPAERSSGRKKPSGSGKKAPPKKPEAAKQGKQAAQTGEQSPSVKTPSVMKLIQDSEEFENQVIAAGKSRIPRQLRGIEPLSRVIRREAEAEKQLEEKQSAPLVTKELTGLIAEKEAPEILARFNACDCEVCKGELARLAAEELPARYIRLPEGEGLDWDGFSDDEKLLAGSVKKSVTTVMIRLMMANKKRNFHS